MSETLSWRIKMTVQLINVGLLLCKRKKATIKKERKMKNEKLKAQQWRGKTFMQMENFVLMTHTQTDTPKM